MVLEVLEVVLKVLEVFLEVSINSTLSLHIKLYTYGRTTDGPKTVFPSPNKVFRTFRTTSRTSRTTSRTSRSLQESYKKVTTNYKHLQNHRNSYTPLLMRIPYAKTVLLGGCASC